MIGGVALITTHLCIVMFDILNIVLHLGLRAPKRGDVEGKPHSLLLEDGKRKPSDVAT